MLEPYLTGKGIPVAVVAGKADLMADGWDEGARRGRELAQEMGGKFGIVSALEGDGVKDCVEELAARVLERRGVEKL